MVKGVIEFFNDGKGYGFIAREDGESEDVFFHVTEALGFEPREGDEVEFEVEPGDRGPRATNVRKV